MLLEIDIIAAPNLTRTLRQPNNPGLYFNLLPASLKRQEFVSILQSATMKLIFLKVACDATQNGAESFKSK